jgi:hypothetical protein
MFVLRLALFMLTNFWTCLPPSFERKKKYIPFSGFIVATTPEKSKH